MALDGFTIWPVHAFLFPFGAYQAGLTDENWILVELRLFFFFDIRCKEKMIRPKLLCLPCIYKPADTYIYI